MRNGNEIAPLLSASGVTKVYSRTSPPVLDGLNFQVRPGECLFLCGPNGSGKTTLLHAIVGLIPLNRGTIEVQGVSLQSSPSEAKRRLGFVPDVHSLPLKMTAEEYLQMIGSLQGISRQRFLQRFQFVGDWFGVRDFLGAPLETLSHGMTKRLLVAAAFLAEPALLLVDEPEAGLDGQAAMRFWTLVRKQCTTGGGALVATHLPPRRVAFQDRILFLEKGAVREISEEGMSWTAEPTALTRGASKEVAS